MSWFKNLKLKPKLLSAFGLCALITLGVAGLGGSGISTLYGQLQDIVSNNLFSIQKTDLVKANVIATNRDLYKAVALASVKADPKDIDAAIASFKDNQAEALSNFKLYRATPLEPDERAAGDAFENDWPAYVAQTDKVFQALQAGDMPRATELLMTAVTPAYKTAVAEVKVMTESNARQAGEVATESDQTSARVTRALVIGSAVAVLLGMILGLLITRAITRPLYQSVESARHVAKGDLTQTIPAGGKDEVGMLLRALGEMQGNLKNHRSADRRCVRSTGLGC
ncbi:MCP four helix bundle domain-containing protein [Pseudomonas sp. KNUC1026]|uniref:MCP four helix bundle domain-containing protein n=1 Tax=Pseudomonas sp. KNUC1026 TaxID=2893890 RepID=UPI003FA7B4DE